MKHRIVLILVMGLVLTACRRNGNALFQRLTPGNTGIDFTNQLTDSLSVLDFEYKYNGGGVALANINGDSLPDLVFTGNQVPGKIYLNKGNLKFEDITSASGFATSGWCNGIAVVDINGDGFSDIYICRAGPRNTAPAEMKNLFFINNGNNTFTEKAVVMGLADDGYDIQSAFFDYDGDGDLDMYLVRNGFVNYNRNTARNINTEGQAPSTGKLFRNDSNLHFTDVSKEAGITIEGFGLGVAICDVNKDDHPDIYVSNDFLTSDLLYINNGDGTFTNDAKKCLRHTSYNGMGNDVADFNNDGNEDIAVVDMLPPDNRHWKKTMMGNTYDEFSTNLLYGFDCQYVRNTLQLNNGDGTFSEIGQLAGVHQTDWSWSPLFADFDNDGWKDLYISNGYRQDVTDLDFIHYGAMAVAMGTPEAKRKERLEQLKKVEGIRVHNYLFKNDKNLQFTDVSEDWGFTQKGFSNGAVYGDLDGDGDLDIITNNIDEPAAVYENKSSQLHPKNGWLQVKLQGPAANRDGLGAKLWLWQNGVMQFQYVSPYRGYLSTMEPVAHFGIMNKKIDSLKVQWPDGKVQVLKNVSPKQLLKLNYTNAVAAVAKSNFATQSVFFQPFNDSVNIRFTQEEDEYSDFKLQPLLPHMLSHEGPGLAVSDVNGDGLEDFFVGNGTDFRGRLFIQNSNGSFTKKDLTADTGRNIADDMGALFFDADGDGDSDLYLAKGGVAKSTSLPGIYQHKFYINDGKGTFTPAPQSIPTITSSASSVAAADYDRDGDLDLLVAGRVVPGSYPLSPKSYLLRNDSKNGICHFTEANITAGLPPEMGMVTDALWTDFNADGWTDLIVVGEFMPIRFFKNEKGHFTETTAQTSLQNTSGWWNSLTAADFDHDGDIDYMAGNLGLNSGLKASPAEPITVYAADFDKNGRLDPLMTHYVDGKEQLVHARDDINRQITAMRLRFKDYNTYAETAFKDAFTKEELDTTKVLKAKTFASAWIENKGGGKFTLHPLPLEAQLSPIYGTVSSDFTGDGLPDVLCVGNSFATEVNIGRYDAQGGLLLINDGKGNFRTNRNIFNIGGDNKSLGLIGVGNKMLALVGANSGELKSYKLNQPGVKSIAIQPQETYAIITLKNGIVYRQEAYWGSSYLSQSSRVLRLPASGGRVVLFTIQGKSREVTW